MKKTFILLLLAAFVGSFIVVNCTKDETKTAKISGLVKFDGQIAAGALVLISSEPNAAKVLTTSVTDSAGSYTFIGISDGTYYLSSKFNTENTNRLKSSTGVVFTTAGDVQISVSGTDMVKDIELVSNTATGTDKVDGTWTFDQTHSHIGFSFDYDSANAEFGGQFAVFGLDKFEFDQANPANTKIEAWIDITSTETGAPTTIDTINKKAVGGRDGLNGCISHTFGVLYAEADTFFKGYYRTSSVLSGGELIPSAKATFVSSSVAAYGDGYVAKGNLVFNGFTKETSIYFHYIKGYAGKDRAGNLNTYSSFSGFFDMNALVDFNIKSGHVKSKPVHITTNLQFYKKQ